MKKYISIFILIYLCLTQSVNADMLNTSGFIPGQIWYSKEPLVEGDTVKIFTAIWNNSASPLSAKVEFYDKNVLLGTRDVLVAPSGLTDTSVSWKVTSGDHSISAKIISPSITSSGKKKVVSLGHYATTVDIKFVPVVIKTIDGKPATSGDIIKNQIDKAGGIIDNIIPTSVTVPVSENLGLIETFRTDLFKKISNTKTETQNEIDLLNKIEKVSVPTTTTNNIKTTEKKVPSGSVKSNTTDATEKPIAYLKIFFFLVLSFIFGNKIVFYALIVLVLFFIFRGAYRKIRNR